MWKLYEYLLLLTPILSGFIISAICPMGSDSGSDVKFRPPSWVFGVAWPILYLLLGLSWVLAQQKNKNYNYLYLLLNSLLCMWIIVFSCYNSQKNSVFILLGTIILAIMCFTSGVMYSQLALSPLIGWLIFALLMNTTLVQESQ